MYSNRYIALHCCQEKYFSEIEREGISKETKAVFILDLKNINKKEIYNTLAVITYHGIGIDGWKSMLIDAKKLNEIDKSLVISIARISKEQEEIIKKGENCNHYKIIGNGERTLDYCKIKDIGPIKSIINIEKQKLDNTSIIKNEKIDPIKNRFFIKDSYENSDIESKENSVKDIQSICYKIANEQIDSIMKDIAKIRINIIKEMKVVIFDVDDTLIYTIETAYKKTNKAGKKVFNVELKKSEFISLYGKYNFIDCIKHWYNVEDTENFVREYNNIKMEYEYIGDIEKLLKELKKQNIMVGVVTNSTQEKTERKLKEYIKLLDFIYCDAEKPNTTSIKDIIEKYKVSASEVILIGDSENDYQASKDAKINFCGVNTGKKKWEKTNTIFISSVNDLIKESKSNKN